MALFWYLGSCHDSCESGIAAARDSPWHRETKPMSSHIETEMEVPKNDQIEKSFANLLMSILFYVFVGLGPGYGCFLN